jgi:hypothetical protein
MFSIVSGVRFAMRKLVLVSLIIAAIGFIAGPAKADRVHFGVYLGGPGCCYYNPYYPSYYYPGAYSYYYAPPPVIYAPAPAPSVVYTTPAVVYATPVGSSPIPADQTSPTFTDNFGRTCRNYQATAGIPSSGTACLQSDGSWRTVP